MRRTSVVFLKFEKQIRTTTIFAVGFLVKNPSSPQFSDFSAVMRILTAYYYFPKLNTIKYKQFLFAYYAVLFAVDLTQHSRPGSNGTLKKTQSSGENRS